MKLKITNSDTTQNSNCEEEKNLKNTNGDSKTKILKKL